MSHSDFSCLSPTSCYYSYFYKELKVLLTLAFFFKGRIKPELKTVLMRWLVKLLFFIGVLEILLGCLGTHLFLLLPSIFALWLLASAVLSPYVVLLHVDCVAASLGLVSQIYCA